MSTLFPLDYASLKTCLLVSDDPDDHQLLFEAVKEISTSIILTIVLEGDHVLQILNEGKIRPDFIVVDTSMESIGNSFMTKLRSSDKLKNIPIIIYTDNAAEPDNYSRKMVLSKRLTYPEMRSKLKTLLLTPPDELNRETA